MVSKATFRLRRQKNTKIDLIQEKKTGRKKRYTFKIDDIIPSRIASLLLREDRPDGSAPTDPRQKKPKSLRFIERQRRDRHGAPDGGRVHPLSTTTVRKPFQSVRGTSNGTSRCNYMVSDVHHTSSNSSSAANSYIYMPNLLHNDIDHATSHFRSYIRQEPCQILSDQADTACILTHWSHSAAASSPKAAPQEPWRPARRSRAPRQDTWPA